MKETRLLMGMPITVEISEERATQADLDAVFAFFSEIDDRFSTYKTQSEVSRLNAGTLTLDEASPELRTILTLSEQTRLETRGYFDIRSGGLYDPSGLVKGWAVREAADLLRAEGLRHFSIEAGGDVQLVGLREGRPWRVGIRNPFNRQEYVKVLALSDCGIATSGTAVRGQHIYNPHQPEAPLLEILSLTVIGPDIYDADRFATAAFAMGREGLRFIAGLRGFEGYMIDAQARATFTAGFERYVLYA